MIVTFCVIGLVIALGILFSFGKGEFLIAGFNTMKKENQELFDKPAMCKFMGKMMFVFAFAMTLWGLSDYLQKPIYGTIGTVLFFVTIIFMLIYMNTGNRFKK